MTSMMPYHRNNIIFRISSSDSIGKFKQAQAHAFMQLTRTDLKFDVSAREVVLLEFDRFSQWIYKMERVMQAVGEGQLGQQLKNGIIESFNSEISIIDGILQTHIGVFDDLVVKFTQLIHVYSSFFITEQLTTLLDEPVHRAFKILTDNISEYLQHLLMCLHEYNANLVIKTRPPFVSIADFGLNLVNPKTSPFTAIKMRAEFFRDHDCGSTFELKNYSSVNNLFEPVSAALVETGINMIPEHAVTCAA